MTRVHEVLPVCGLACLLAASACGAGVTASRSAEETTSAGQAVAERASPCSPFEIVPIDPSWELAAVIATSETHAFVLGEDGLIAAVDGDRVTRVESPTSAHLWHAWARSPNEIYAWGSEGAVRYDGARWSVFELPSTALGRVVDMGGGDDALWVAMVRSLHRHRDGRWETWPNEGTASSLWSDADDEAWLTLNGFLRRFADGTFTAPRSDRELLGRLIAGLGSQRFLSSSDDMSVAWLDSDEWQTQELGTTSPRGYDRVLAFAGRPDAVYRLAHHTPHFFDGARWLASAELARMNLVSLSQAGRTLYAIGVHSEAGSASTLYRCTVAD